MGDDAAPTARALSGVELLFKWECQRHAAAARLAAYHTLAACRRVRDAQRAGQRVTINLSNFR